MDRFENGSHWNKRFQCTDKRFSLYITIYSSEEDGLKRCVYNVYDNIEHNFDHPLTGMEVVYPIDHIDRNFMWVK